ncbi:hypothetical protein [Curtobacterium herbarum]|uniref:Htaa domain-containing protein n=1 Tax=Curtobacterium herbarum TaxID=150122 RepID=A0ABN1ZEI8_9MICO|nr:hypothetical protein [Curtobacterium herbarum]MBM7476736.1 hypothetical protein [Curtobacterium herbarum]MCS6546147.1 hypothetical protein [Curtobacterium herbarum]
MTKKSTSLVAAAGLVLALGAPLVGSIPANAAPAAPTSSASSTASTSGDLGPGGHVFTGNTLTITSSIHRDGVYVVSGHTTLPNKDIEIAAGSGWKAAGKTDARGDFTATLVGPENDGYAIRFGKRVTPTLFGVAYQTSWYAVPVS